MKFTFAQQDKNVVYYEYGYDGIELFYKKGDSTIIYSNFKSRPDVRREVGTYFLKNYYHIKPGMVTVKLDKAIIEGRFEILRKGTLVCLNYYYHKVTYKDSITMIYKKPLKKK